MSRDPFDFASFLSFPTLGAKIPGHQHSLCVQVQQLHGEGQALDVTGALAPCIILARALTLPGIKVTENEQGIPEIGSVNTRA